MPDSASHSAWKDVVPPPFPALEDHLRTDVCVIGAGIAGLTTAYLLTQAGKRVIVIDDRALGGGETGRSSAHLSTALDDRYYALERLHGADGTRLAAASHRAAIALIELVVREHGIACDFERVDGYLFLGPDDSDQLLDAELAAAQRAGLQEVERLAASPLAFTGPCLRFGGQAQFHPLKYLIGLAAAVRSNGGEIYCDTHATGVEDGHPCEVTTTTAARITADAVVVATNVPINDRAVMHTKQAPYRSYVLGFGIPRDSVPRALYWDTPDPYHYLRVHRPDQGEQDLLLVGGEDHKTGQDTQTDEHFARLETWVRERLPQAGAILHRWSGQIIEPVDGLAFIGRNPTEKHVYIATGDSGNGLTHGTIAGMLIRDLVLGRENLWAKLYDPGRKTLGALGEFARENLNVARHYGDWLKSAEVDAVEAIAPGSGALMRRGLHKIAVYRDPEGRLSARSALCPHLGCAVNWNPTEHSWDCPCHGSRFGTDGRVINGPASVGLDPVVAPQEQQQRRA